MHAAILSGGRLFYFSPAKYWQQIRSRFCMSKEQLLHELRAKFIDLALEFSRRVKSGESFSDLQLLNEESTGIVERIHELAHDLKSPG